MASYTKRSRSGRSRSRITRPPMFGPVANSKMVSRSRFGSPAPKIRIGNSQPSSKSLLSSRPRGSSGAQLGNSVWFPDSKAATKSLPFAAARARGAWAGTWMRSVEDAGAAAAEADREHLIGLVERDEGAAPAGEDDAHGLVGGGDAVARRGPGASAPPRGACGSRRSRCPRDGSRRAPARRPSRCGPRGAPRRSTGSRPTGISASKVSSAGSAGSMASTESVPDVVLAT